MARYRNTRNGVVVDVDDVTAAALGAAYVPADESAEVPTPPAKKVAAPKPAGK